MRLTLIISSLSSGGAERVMSTMANYWAIKGWQINLLTFDNGSVPPFYNLDYRVKHLPLGIASNSNNPLIALWQNAKRLIVLRQAIRNTQPEMVISFMDKVNVLTLLATRGLRVPVVISERSVPGVHQIGYSWEWLRKLTYPLAAKLVVQTRQVKTHFAPKIQERTTIIQNMVFLTPSDEISTLHSLSKPTVMGMGRFTEEKGFDLLIQAFAKVKDRYPKWTLTILGEGPLRQELENLCSDLGLTNRVYFLGRVKNPYRFLRQADIFILPSRFEGFPNALCEAMASGLPVISFDCPSGPREIIRDGVDGLLVPPEDINTLAETMEQLMKNESERKRLGTNALEITERLSLERIMQEWEQLLKFLIVK
ncbi:MAG: group 1 glycosyl transferase [Thiotrichaceae bacterium IS1]|nr:MAG: group 1 glycosyl transferase [Thiotrichaceae bacterium IS1]